MFVRILITRITFGLFLLTLLLDSATAQERLKVYIFAGQSNCGGTGSRILEHTFDVTDWQSLYAFQIGETAYFDGPIRRWRYFESGRSGSHMLYPFIALDQNRSGFLFDRRVGPEVQFARSMRRAFSDDIAVIKLAVAGSIMNDWEPARRYWASGRTAAERSRLRASTSPRLFYQQLLPLVNRSLERFQNTDKLYFGKSYDSVELAGFVWIQGESDLCRFSDTDCFQTRPFQAAPNNLVDWEESFEHMIVALRAIYNLHMPFVVVQTRGNRGFDFENPSFPNGDSVRSLRLTQAQQNVANRDALGRFVGTESAMISRHLTPLRGVPDLAHWDTVSLQQIAREIAAEFLLMDSTN